MKKFIFLIFVISILFPVNSYAFSFSNSREVVWDYKEFDIDNVEDNNDTRDSYYPICMGGYLFMKESRNTYSIVQIFVEKEDGHIHPVHCKTVKKD